MRVLGIGLPLVTAAMFLLSACDQEISADQDGPPDVVQNGYVLPYGMPEKARAVDFESVESAAIRQHYALLRSQLIDLLDKSIPTKQKSQLIRTFLEEEPSSPVAPFVEQFAAHGMLTRLLDESNVDVESISFYTRLLIENHSPDAELIYRALDRLTERWSVAEIGDAGRLTIDRAIRWTERVCAECSGGIVAKKVVNEGVEAKRRAVLNAIEGLAQLAGP